MAHRMAREFEVIDDLEIYALCKLVSVVNHYFDHWSDDRTAADPDNLDYLP
jgi:hypothetical protein